MCSNYIDYGSGGAYTFANESFANQTDVILLREDSDYPYAILGGARAAIEEVSSSDCADAYATVRCAMLFPPCDPATKLPQRVCLSLCTRLVEICGAWFEDVNARLASVAYGVGT